MYFPALEGSYFAMLKTILCNQDNTFTDVGNPEEISDLLRDQNHLVWMDLAAPTLAEFRLLRAEFGLHPLAIEDAMSRHQRPKVDQYENFYFVVFYAVQSQDKDPPPRVPGRAALSGSNYMRSPRYHDDPASPPPDAASAALRPAAPDAAEMGDPHRVLPLPNPTMQPLAARPIVRGTDYDSPDPQDWAADRIVLREISMFMGPNYLITVHQEPVDELEEVAYRWKRNVEAMTGRDVSGVGSPADPNGPKPLGNGARPKNGGGRGTFTENDIGILLYSLLDTLVDNYFPVIDTIVDRVEGLEEDIFERFDANALESIFTLKKDLLALRKVLAPERDVLNILSRRDLPIFNDHTLVYFQDVYDHVVRITDSIDTYRDLLSSALDSYLSMQSNRLNITVQTLTSASIILMALSLITGIYGTNFDNIPELHFQYGYFAMLGVMLVVAVGLYVIFKRRGWL